MKNQKIILGLVVIVIGFFWNDISKMLHAEPVTISNKYNQILKLEQPSSELIQDIGDVKSIVSGPDQVEDRESIAVFSNEMAKRVTKYNNVTTLDFENYYFEAGKLMFEGKLSKKYLGLNNKMRDIVASTLGENEAIIAPEDFEKFSKKLKALSWVLLN